MHIYLFWDMILDNKYKSKETNGCRLKVDKIKRFFGAIISQVWFLPVNKFSVGQRAGELQQLAADH